MLTVGLSYADTLLPGTWGWDLVWKQGLYRYNQVTMRSFGWTLISSGWCPYRKNRDTQRRQLCEDGGRDWSGAATCRGHWSHQKLEQVRKDPLWRFQRAFSGPAGLVASTPVESMAALSSHPVCGPSYSNPGQRAQPVSGLAPPTCPSPRHFPA